MTAITEALDEFAEASLNALILIAHVARRYWAAAAITAGLWVALFSLFTWAANS
jgi:hypothetical protein